MGWKRQFHKAMLCAHCAPAREGREWARGAGGRHELSVLCKHRQVDRGRSATNKKKIAMSLGGREAFLRSWGGDGQNGLELPRSVSSSRLLSELQRWEGVFRNIYDLVFGA